MAITLVGTATASAITVAVPAHLPGDLILIWALRGGSTTAPTLPSGYISLTTESESTATSCSARLGYKIATSTSDTSGSWTNASELICHVYRASSGYTMRVGQVAVSKSTTATISYPALSPMGDAYTGNSWVVGFVGAGNITQTLTNAPSGMTNESSVVGSTYAAAGFDTEGGVTSWSTETASAGSTGSTVSATVEIVLAPTGSGLWATNVYQHVGGGGSDYGQGLTVNDVKIPLPKISGAGNCLVLAITNDGGATISSVVGVVNGSFGSPAVTALLGSGYLDSRIYVLPNIQSGLETITVTFAASVTTFQYCITEFYGVAASFTATSGSTVQSSGTTPVTTLSTGSLTPPNNNSQGGNILWAYHCKSDQIPTNETTALFESANFSFLNADIGWADGPYSLTKAVQVYLQTSSAAINPTLVSANEVSGDNWNSLVVAIQISNGAGTVPPSGMQVQKIDHFTTEIAPATGVPYALQIPSIGNLRVLTAAAGTSIAGGAVYDSEGNTWTADSVGAGFWYLPNATPNPNLIVYIPIASGFGGTNFSVRYYCIEGAATAPFDSVVLSAQVISDVSTFTASPSPSPTSSSGITIANIGLGTGPGLAVTAPSGAIWDLCTYTGETDSDSIENADIEAHYAYSAAGAQTWTFTITPIDGNSTTGGFINFIAAPLATINLFKFYANGAFYGAAFVEGGLGPQILKMYANGTAQINSMEESTPLHMYANGTFQSTQFLE